MKARMQELLALLTMVVERIGAANARTAEAEGRAERMSVLLDALSDENAALQAALDQAEDAATASAATIRALRAEVEAGERLAETLEARAVEAELRIFRAAEALTVSTSPEPPVSRSEALPPSAALH